MRAGGTSWACRWVPDVGAYEWSRRYRGATLRLAHGVDGRSWDLFVDGVVQGSRPTVHEAKRAAERAAVKAAERRERADGAEPRPQRCHELERELGRWIPMRRGRR